MARYIKQEMNDLNGTGEKRSYYRMKIEGNISMDKFIERIAFPGSGVSQATVLHVMTAVAEQLARSLAQGQSVTLDGIGTFKPRLGVVKGKEMDTIDGSETKRNARSIEVNGISFRADKALVRETNQYCDLERGGISRVKDSPYTEEERLSRALRYLDEHTFMRVVDYMKLTGLKRTRATLELQRLASDPASGIVREGWGTHRVYVRGKR